MEISAQQVKELRAKSGAGVMECRNALQEAQGDIEKASQLLKERGLVKAEKKAERVTSQGLVEAYIHVGGRIGAIVEVNCESDFVARTSEFRELAHNLAMQVAALSPQYVSQEDIPQGAEVDPQSACLMQQPYIRDSCKTIKDLVVEAVAKLGENIRVKRFARFELGNY